jgi:hypothetical protein
MSEPAVQPVVAIATEHTPDARSFLGEVPMKSIVLDLPTFVFVITTRAALAAGVGLLVSGQLSNDRRRRVGAALVAIGAFTTVPAAISLMRGIRRRRRRAESFVNHDHRLIGATRFPRKGDDVM